MPVEVLGKTHGKDEFHDKNLLISAGANKSYGSLSSMTVSGSVDLVPESVKRYGLFGYSETLDYILITIGTIASIIHGAGFPLLSIVLGGMTTVFLRAQNSPFVTGVPAVPVADTGGVPPITQEEFTSEVTRFSLYYLGLGVLMFLTSYIQIACWESVAERMVNKLRNNYLLSILRQEIAWFDTKQTGNLTARLTDDLERVREGLGDKLSLFIQMISGFIAGFVIGFVYNWQMALVMLIFTPFLALTNAWMAKITSQRTAIEQKKYAVAGAIAEETFSSMRTVHALNAQRQELDRYEVALEDGRRTGLIKYFYMGVGVGSSHITMYLSYAVAFYFGSLLVSWDPNFNRGTVFTVFFSVMNGSTALGGALPHLTSMSMAKGAAKSVLSVINNHPKIDPYSENGIIPTKVRGAIDVNNVHFRYPLRKDVKILNGISIKVRPGEKVALVGSSGCGKSTIVNLLLRFYDPEQGNITLDGHDLRELNVKSLRDAIGIVSQEPILFDGTLEENVLLGNELGSREDVIRCLKAANAYGFITKLPDGLYTRVGERGVQLSGGQKQRIAIARALIKNPKILLLDEATSALDTESERIVQQALDKAMEGRTTIVVAHRLSTIRDADQIHIFKDGQIIESGRHEELIATRGVYYEMVEAQQLQRVEEEEKMGALEEDVFEDPEIPENTSATAPSVRSRMSRTTSAVSRKVSRKMSSHAESVVSRVSDAQDIREMQEQIEDSLVKPTSMSKIFNMNRDSWHFLLFGLAGCTLSGLVTPFFALVYSQIFQVFSEPIEQMKSDAIFWSAMFLVLGLVSAGGFFLSSMMLGRCGEALTKKLRYEAFKNLLRQDIGFYDDDRHGTGKLCTRFATDAPNVRYVFTRLPVVMSSVVTLIGAIIIGFMYGWQLALVLLAVIPLILASGYFEMSMQFGKAMQDSQLLEEAGKVAGEAVENIRTVQGLNKQFIFHEKYVHHLQEPFKANMRHAQIYALVFAFSQSVVFFMYAIAFYLGSIFVNNHSMDPLAVYRVFFAMVFCGQAVGQISSFIPDVVKSRLAASLIFHMIEYPTLIDSLSDWGIMHKVTGNINFNNVHFAYPTRSHNRILSGINLNVKAGETVALVGFSGCGKSTIMALLERWYNPLKGHITIDGVSIRDLNIHSLREQVCIVSQEPILFDTTIEGNIVYGLDGPVTHDVVVAACEQANIHSFILGLPEGYQTRVGEKGTQLSGGQKQRIAIARALVRQPAVLLLDEATSALDSESEKVVQDALEKAKQGRTCLVIAHRLSTVQNADKIVVINDGGVAEQGTHEQLYRKGGIYRALCDTQFLDEKSKSTE
uniref:p-glycoprotein n=1 Tax=Panagrellus redivivus TaxID=6233 RepID=A0A7E4VKT7_PANRE